MGLKDFLNKVFSGGPKEPTPEEQKAINEEFEKKCVTYLVPLLKESAKKNGWRKAYDDPQFDDYKNNWKRGQYISSTDTNLKEGAYKKARIIALLEEKYGDISFIDEKAIETVLHSGYSFGEWYDFKSSTNLYFIEKYHAINPSSKISSETIQLVNLLISSLVENYIDEYTAKHPNVRDDVLERISAPETNPELEKEVRDCVSEKHKVIYARNMDTFGYEDLCNLYNLYDDSKKANKDNLFFNENNELRDYDKIVNAIENE